MTVSLVVRLEGEKDLLASLKRVKSTLSLQNSTALGRRFALEGQRVARQLTPRRSGGRNPDDPREPRGAPFRDQWRIHEQVATTTAYRAVIKSLAADEPDGLLALASVEFGAVGHTILSRGPWPMRWYQGGTQVRFLGRRGLGSGPNVVDKHSRTRRTSGMVFARLVDHPGHRPFYMVRNTRRHLHALVNRTLVDLRDKIEAEFGTISISVR